jgi:hypothetical protein
MARSSSFMCTFAGLFCNLRESGRQVTAAIGEINDFLT